MKAFMYHYVRESSSSWPFSKHKEINQFMKECKYLKNSYDFLNIKDLSVLKKNKKPILFLTFDDAIKDHLKAAEILRKLDIKGTFFIPIKPYLSKSILPVHKAQLICSKVGGDSIHFLEKATLKLDINLDKIINRKEEKKFKKRYEDQDDDDKIKKFKKIVNYIGDFSIVENILDEITRELEIKNDYLSFYLSPDEIKYINSQGFEIGSHGFSHKPLSRLSKEEQDYELGYSKKYLENMLNQEIFSFCYPFGRKTSYDSNTINLLKEKGYKYAVSVEPRDINPIDLTKNNYELPRFDCNQISKIFPEINI